MDTHRRHSIALICVAKNLELYFTRFPPCDEDVSKLCLALEVSKRTLLEMYNLAKEVSVDGKEFSSIKLSTAQGDFLLSLIKMRLRDKGFLFQLDNLGSRIKRTIKGTDIREEEALAFVRDILHELVDELQPGL